MDKEDRSLWLILVGIVVFSLFYTLSARTENALWLVLAAICLFIVAYRLYGSYIAGRVAGVSAAPATGTAGRETTGAWALFGYQLASTAGVGVLVGPVLAAQFGYLPAYVWILLAAVAGGGVHDLVVLIASKRRRGAFLPLLAAAELGPWAGLATWGLVLIGLLAFLAVSGSLLIDALAGNLWAFFAIAITIVVAIAASMYEAWLRPGKTGEAIAFALLIGVLGILIGARLDRFVAPSFLANRTVIVALLALYCFISTMLPLRALGRARVAISGYITLGLVVLLAAGIALAGPSLRQPALSQYVDGGGPLSGGGALPYVFIIITAGAICGFNGLSTSAVASRLLRSEDDAVPVAYGAKLVQGLLVVLVLVVLSTLPRWDFYAITTSLPLNELERVAGAQQRVWDDLRGQLQADTVRFPGGPTGESRHDNIRSPLGVTAISAAGTWAYREFPAFRRAWLPTLYRLLFVLQALVLLASVEATARAGRVALEEAAKVALHTPPLRARAMDGRATLGLTAVAVAIFTLVWVSLAAKAEVLVTIYFFGFVSLLLAAVGLGVGLAAIRGQSRLHALAVAIPLIVVVVLALVAAGVTVRDSAAYLDKSKAFARAYTTLPHWSGQYRFINTDRAREVVGQWPVGEANAVFEKGEVELARQLQGRLGTGEQEARTVAAALASRTVQLGMWSWVQIVLTLFMLALALVVVLGRFVRVPLQWPGRAPVARPVLHAPPPARPVIKPASSEPPSEGGDFEI